MSVGRKSLIEPVIIHGLLLAGCVIFAFPFFWMLMTSVKVRQEIGSDQLRLIPTTPFNAKASPYFDPSTYPPPKRPEGIPAAVWDAALPALRNELGKMVDAWQPAMPGPEGNPPPTIADRSAFTSEMTDGILLIVGNRISDVARGRALAVEKERRTQAGETPLPRDYELTTQLSPQAVSAGADAIVEEIKRLTDQRVIEQAFDETYRRLLLGDVRIRTKGFQDYSFFPETKWVLQNGPAQLLFRFEDNKPCQEVGYHFTADQPSVTFTFTPASVPISLKEIGRGFFCGFAWMKAGAGWTSK